MDKYILELSAVDLIGEQHIIKLFRTVKSTSYFGSNLELFINSAHLHKLKESLEKQIPTILPSEIYKNQTYQPISKQSAVGSLKFIDNLKEHIQDIEPQDIIVLNESPLYLPQVTGIIVTKFQTPLSHISILGQNRKLPVAAYKGAFENKYLKSLDGQKVSFKVESDTFYLSKTDSAISSHSDHHRIRLRHDLTVRSVVDIKEMNRNSLAFAGNKAANFAYLTRLAQNLDFKTPEHAFCIPFYFYDEHINNSDAPRLIKELLDNKSILKHSDSLQARLREIRKAIKEKPVNAQLISMVNKKVQQQSTYTRFRFRSSTNAEDAAGFSGAGLYTSKTGILNDEKKSFEKAIKKVWASMWSYEAFTEREFYHIDHSEAYMGILVHRAFPDEHVNGVAITKNIYRPNANGFVINAQIGNENVVNPTEGVTCDQIICFPESKRAIYKGKNAFDVITTSSLNNGNLCMSDVEIKTLADQLQLVKKYYFKSTSTNKSFLHFGLDIEFKLDGDNRELYLKQVRIYND